ncbi:N-acetylglucosamine-6-phosphate deacetylase [Saliterribacillus persicus]|uniref:N-acetylglucosamine-6-phosphate deacetylase n=1 Tax=Saliterribacillus persicus TaxID=930114 RepID=A0A368YB66_9BACI|nr:N-acetylglucosamine-6-phosphate deacetylase [Saliterribacillus persicus]RCW77493.1 N-acetylglucosamine 6-phosphate deacetylase [Saliterribacillus persicus]
MAGNVLLKNIQIYVENNVIENGFVKIEEGKITELDTMDRLNNTHFSSEVLDFNNQQVKVIPGMIDVHIHGANGADVMDGTRAALETMSRVLPKEGTTSFLATTMTQSNENIEAALTNIASYMEKQEKAQAEILGVHLEGPFVNGKRKGAQPLEYIKKPDIDLFKKWNKLAQNQIKLVTLAPEVEGGMEFIQYLNEQGVIASAGHTDATAEEISVAVDYGLSHITHLYNQMREFHHREPGVVGAAWLNNDLMVEIIADGIHSTPEAVQTAFSLKGKDNLLLITDSMRAKCLEDNKYDLGGQPVIVKKGKATLEDGTLAGSTLKLGEAFKNILSYTGCSLEEAICMSSRNAARELGLYHRKGSISVGKDADIILLNQKNDILFTFCRGEIAYKGD